MTVDSHHHFWNYSAEEYGWIGEGMDLLKADYAPADLKPQLDEAGIATAQPDPVWLDGMSAVAERKNVFCKISGMVTEVSEGVAVTPDLLRPYFDHVLSVFGPERLMFGSDWPVCRLRSDYGDWITTVRSWIAQLSSDEQSAIMADSARRAYRLDT